MIVFLLSIPFSPSHSVVKSIHAKKGTKNKMVSTRFNIFGYAIIFMLLNFVAYSLQDMEKTMPARSNIEKERIIAFQPDKETLNVVHVSSKVTVKGGIIGGRKMAKMVIKEHMKDEETTLKKASSSSRENLANGDKKPRKRSKNIDDHQVEVKMGSTFMVINADYHVPRSHPPKNN